MMKIAVFVNKDYKLCDFYEAERFVVYERGAKRTKNWAKTSEKAFDRITPSSPAQTRKDTQALLPLITDENCTIIAGGALLGIPFTVFDMAGFDIFMIEEINDKTFDEIIVELEQAKNTEALKEAVVKNAKPAETSTPGVYFLDLVALQNEHPGITSKQALKVFLEETPFLSVTLICRHIPPWIESDTRYNVRSAVNDKGFIEAVITKRC